MAMAQDRQDTGPRTDVALRTNALAIPLANIGVVLPFERHWSVAADFYYPWLQRSQDHRNCLQALAGGLEGRYWFDRSQNNALLGHSIGIFAMAGRYDIERNYHGYQGLFTSMGVDYLYALPVFHNRMHLEFSLGLGIFLSRAREYQVYEPGGNAYAGKNMAKDIQYLGPVKASVSVVVPIRFNRKRGGEL